MTRHRTNHAGIALAICSMLCMAAPVYNARAQAGNRAGLVVQFGDGSVITKCVTFSEPNISGLELLKRSGLDINVDYSGGALICKIGPDGCTSPQESCTCKYPVEKKYWNYWQLSGGVWRYSSLGASLSVVSNGTVEGWRWSAQSDSANATTTMPVRTLDEICANNTSEATQTATATATATNAPTATPTAVPSATPLSIAVLTIADTATPTPAAVAIDTGTPVPTTVVNGTVTPAPDFTNTPAEVSIGAPTLATPTPSTATPTAVLPSATAAVPSSAGDAIAPSVSPAATTAPTTQPQQPQAITARSTPKPVTADMLVVTARVAVPAPIPGLPTPSPTAIPSTAATATDNTWLGYVVFGLLAAGLLGSITLARAYGDTPVKLLGQAFGIMTYVLASIVGVASFTRPFWSPTADDAQSIAPAFVVALVLLCLIAMLFDAQTRRLNTKSIALLGVIVALNSALRFIEVSLPGPGGFTPVFFLIILCGATFGPRFGFLTGAMTLLVSGFVTAGVGPWLPFQMFTAGWMGLSAGWFGALIRRLPTRRYVAGLSIFGALWGFVYGAIMNLWSWPYTLPAAQRLATFDDLLARYAAYYVTTSLVWDLFGALGNALLLALFGAAALRTLRRFKGRFEFARVELVGDP